MMTWYACGLALPAGALGDPDLQRDALNQIKNYMPNLVPTTYESASAYLREECRKPKGERNLLREMCAMMPLGLPKDRKVYLVLPKLSNSKFRLE